MYDGDGDDGAGGAGDRICIHMRVMVTIMMSLLHTRADDYDNDDDDGGGGDAGDAAYFDYADDDNDKLSSATSSS